ncbi:hypothetical protein AB6A40_011638 [Gnathostoma spinigerum]|uniref:Uncharacterized protein n=1 Tax=Gnathostoma spinigerum TaxID=75299 RepID=A0ABD6EY69_9BILA
MFELDLGAFELVEGMTAEELLSSTEPIIFHRDIPVHSVHRETVQTEIALQNLMTAPESLLTPSIPPTFVGDNYCFVVDGENVSTADIMSDEHWWRHTGKPSKYYYSDDLRTFRRVNCITAKGRIMSATLVKHASPASSHIHSPGSSRSGTTCANSASRHSLTSNKPDTLPLSCIYKVTRVYSFWKTCTAFHRIVTMISRGMEDEQSANDFFRKRLFVQYLWRNAKPSDKARVQREFDPSKQRLLKICRHSIPRRECH